VKHAVRLEIDVRSHLLVLSEVEHAPFLVFLLWIISISLSEYLVFLVNRYRLKPINFHFIHNLDYIMHARGM